VAYVYNSATDKIEFIKTDGEGLIKIGQFSCRQGYNPDENVYCKSEDIEKATIRFRIEEEPKAKFVESYYSQKWV